MSFKDEKVRKQENGEGLDPVLRDLELRDMELQDQALIAALASFRLSVYAWSEAAYNRPRAQVAVAPRRRVWRLAAAWGLGCVLVAGGVSGGVYERHQKQARVAAALEAERQRQLATEREEEELMAKVDSDVSRQVPSAMEPLAQLMAEDETR